MPGSSVGLVEDFEGGDSHSYSDVGGERGLALRFILVRGGGGGGNFCAVTLFGGVALFCDQEGLAVVDGETGGELCTR